MRLLLARAAALALVTAMTTTAAGASTVTSTLSITATIASACSFSAPTYQIDISTLIVLPNSGVAQATPVSITCATGVPYSVTASPGNVGSCADANGRFLAAPVTGGGAGASPVVSYQLQLGTIASPFGSWCDGSTGGSAGFGTTGSGSAQSIAYFLSTPGYLSDPRNPSKLAYPAGTYSDSITLTARF